MNLTWIKKLLRNQRHPNYISIILKGRSKAHQTEAIFTEFNHFVTLFVFLFFFNNIYLLVFSFKKMRILKLLTVLKFMSILLNLKKCDVNY